MKHRTIREAALEVLKRNGKPLSAKAILVGIMIEKKLGVTTEFMPVYVNSLEDTFAEE
jgi:hypothetical protein